MCSNSISNKFGKLDVGIELLGAPRRSKQKEPVDYTSYEGLFGRDVCRYDK